MCKLKVNKGCSETLYVDHRKNEEIPEKSNNLLLQPNCTFSGGSARLVENQNGYYIVFSDGRSYTEQ